jgi:hypothetical protein
MMTPRIAAFVLASVCVGCVSGSPLSASSASAVTSRSVAGWKQFIDRRDGFSIRYPPSWQVHPFNVGCMESFSGVAVSNVAGSFGVPADGCSNGSNTQALALGAVVVLHRRPTAVPSEAG